MNKNDAIVAAMPNVEQIANSVYQEVRNSGVDWEELVAVGNLALCEAAETWEPEQGSLAKYAAKAVRGEMLNHTGQGTRNIRLPERANTTVFKVRKAEDHLCQQLGREPTLTEIADHLGIDENTVRGSWENHKMFIPLGEDATEKRPQVDDQHTDNLENLPAPDCSQDEPAKLLTEKLTNLADRLPQQEREVVASRFGLFGHTAQTVEQIAIRLGINEREVSRIERAALSKLRHPSNTI